MAKVTLTDLATLQEVIIAINENNARLETFAENTLSRDGTAPNTMEADLDMNGQRIFNLPLPQSATDPVRLTDMTTTGLPLVTPAVLIDSGGSINWNSGDVIITHSPNTLTFAGADNGYIFSGGSADIINTTNNAIVEVLKLEGDRSAPANGDRAVLSWYLSSNTGVQTNITQVFGRATSIANGAMSGEIGFVAISAGTVDTRMLMTPTALTPSTTDTMVLGSSTLQWSDLFLASGGVINWNNGDVTITHSADTLTFASATTGYLFQDGPIRPVANDGIALGTAAVSFADLFLASGGVINWANSDVTITHVTNQLTFAGATSGYAFDTGVRVGFTGAAADDTLAVGDANFRLDFNTGTSPFLGFDAGDFLVYSRSANQFQFQIGSATQVGVGSALFFPGANDGVALGTGSLAFSDLFLASGGVINFNNGDVTVTHSTNVLTQANNANATGSHTVSNANAGAAAVAQLVVSTNAGTIATNMFSAAGGNNGQIVFNGSGAFLIDAQNASSNMQLRTGATPTAAININASQFVSLSTGSLGRGNPVTKTGNFSLAATENWLIINQAGTTTVTLPSAATWPGREVMFKTIQAQTLVSNASNVVPRAGGAAGTAMLAATAGNWCTIVSDGTNWILMQGTP